MPPGTYTIPEDEEVDDVDDAIHRHDLEQQHKQTEEELLILKEAKKAERTQLAELLTLRDSIIAGGESG